ncbi:YjgF-like protein [Aspergillus carlsbadensis]|nr:YjgF-like protein [Aspergillus carlsbadensis]
MPTLQYANYPGTKATSSTFHYSQAVQIGNVVRTSGQGGWDETGTVATDDIETEIRLAFDNVERALKSLDSRLSWEDVYAVRSYHVDLDATFELVTRNFKERITSHRPVWTCVQVGKLGIEGMRVEIEVEAYIPV